MAAAAEGKLGSGSGVTAEQAHQGQELQESVSGGRGDGAPVLPPHTTIGMNRTMPTSALHLCSRGLHVHANVVLLVGHTTTQGSAMFACAFCARADDMQDNPYCQRWQGPGPVFP